MPRPLSMTLIELSVWIVTVISLQKPASASSMALPLASITMWYRPFQSEVSPMYMPGRLRTASSPFSTLMLSESYWSRGGSFFSASDIYSLLVQIRIGITTYLKSSRPGRVNSALELASPHRLTHWATWRLLGATSRYTTLHPVSLAAPLHLKTKDSCDSACTVCLQLIFRLPSP